MCLSNNSIELKSCRIWKPIGSQGLHSIWVYILATANLVTEVYLTVFGNKPDMKCNLEKNPIASGIFGYWFKNYHRNFSMHSLFIKLWK